MTGTVEDSGTAEDVGGQLSQTLRNNYYLRFLFSYEASDVRYRIALAVAVLSVAFQEYPIWIRQAVKIDIYGRPLIDVLGLALVLSALLILPAATSRLAVALFAVVAVVAIVPDWTSIANHSYLAIWSIPVALLFRDWWKSDLYAYYLRLTLGLVMIAAFSQKILAGTYVDGSYLTYMSMFGSTTERMFSVFCDPNNSGPCAVIRYISIFILGWQLIVGILLLAGLSSIVFLMVEIAFLLGAGVYADEMNFQVLNIALLCIVFRYGMPMWLLVTCGSLLVLDLFGLSKIASLVMANAL